MNSRLLVLAFILILTVSLGFVIFVINNSFVSTPTFNAVAPPVVTPSSISNNSNSLNRVTAKGTSTSSIQVRSVVSVSTTTIATSTSSGASEKNILLPVAPVSQNTIKSERAYVPSKSAATDRQISAAEEALAELRKKSFKK